MKQLAIFDAVASGKMTVDEGTDRLMAPRCPCCGDEGQRVIYMGLPMWLCSDGTCCTGWGFWSFLPILHFTGCFMAFEGSYWRALWAWLRNDP